MKTEDTTKNEKQIPNCNVSSTFNRTVGIIAIAAASIIAYFVYQYFK